MAGNSWKRRRRIVCERVAALRYNARRCCVIVHQPKREFQTKEAATQSNEIAGPADCDRHVANCVFKNEVPTDDPRDDFTERRVGIGVSRSRNRNHRGELGITKRSESARDPGYYERKHNSRTRTRPAKHQGCVRNPRLHEIQYRRFPN